MCPAIHKPTNCKVHAAIHFLHTKTINAADIHNELCMCDLQQMLKSKGTARQCHYFLNVHFVNSSTEVTLQIALASPRFRIHACKLQTPNSLNVFSYKNCAVNMTIFLPASHVVFSKMWDVFCFQTSLYVLFLWACSSLLVLSCLGTEMFYQK
jgi:hypothetical protein